MLSERPHRPLLPLRLFLVRQIKWFLAAAALIALAAGYHWCAGLAWLDAFLNAAMILTPARSG